jgi:hypothetical protein
VHYTLAATFTLYSSGGYAYYIGFSDGIPLGNPGGLGSSPQSPTAGALYSGSGKIYAFKSSPTYPGLIAADWIIAEEAASATAPTPTPWVNAGFTKVKISSPNLSETAFPLATYAGFNGISFPAPSWNTTGGPVTIKFIK